ncbi:MAG TPA: heme ABC exporter ATP-binding protein CcmA [Hellea balneolensis]|uniref:Heme ABC exporter ATP-binding protein CcmA n=1 Tax=Hellea balneolensis TaxID=287478 RepID=A0A7V5NWL7_9PROT|nr:heme ABC exporter ATP-binding protein CcmA [Hellea balneolensis]
MNTNSHADRIDVTGLDILRGDRLLVEDVNFSMHGGDTLWVAGRNGIGKTSLLRCIAGLLRPAHGKVNWNGQDVHRHAPQGIAYQGHQDGHKPNLTAGENLAFWKTIYKSDSEISTVLDRVGLNDRAHVRAKGLSAGQSRRLALARLLLSGARLWILDEPAAAMDVAGQDLIDNLIAEHVAEGGLAMIASHTPPRKIGKHSRVLTIGDVHG